MVWQWVVWGLGLLALAFYAQYQRVLAENLAEALLVSHAWVDEIIEALEDKDEDSGNKRIEGLVHHSPVDRGDGGSDPDLHERERD